MIEICGSSKAIAWTVSPACNEEKGRMATCWRSKRMYMIYVDLHEIEWHYGDSYRFRLLCWDCMSIITCWMYGVASQVQIWCSWLWSRNRRWSRYGGALRQLSRQSLSLVGLQQGQQINGNTLNRHMDFIGVYICLCTIIWNHKSLNRISQVFQYDSKFVMPYDVSNSPLWSQSIPTYNISWWVATSGWVRGNHKVRSDNQSSWYLC